MSWSKIDDGFAQHPKVIGLSDAAFRLHVTAIAYCSRHHTDGELTAAALPSLYPRANPARLVVELVECDLWIETEGGWRLSRVPAWVTETAQDVHDAARKRARRCRHFLVERDGEKCASCGAEGYLEVDHRTPLSRGGSSEPSNLSLLCRPCNADKGARTWEEWTGI